MMDNGPYALAESDSKPYICRAIYEGRNGGVAMDANAKGGAPRRQQNRKDQRLGTAAPSLPAHDTNEWQDLADRADLVADDRSDELEQLAGDEVDWHPAPTIYEEI